MKKYFYFAAALLFAAISCTKETPDTTAERPVSPELSGRKTIVLNIAGPDTKTYVSDPATGAVSWETGDVVGVFTDKDATPIEFALSGAAGTSATFTGEVSEGASKIYVFYPYSADATFADGKITMALPSEQSVGANNVAKGAMVTVGEATKGGNGSYSARLHNAFSYIKFKITGDDIKEIVLSGGSDKLAGTATFSVADGTMTGTGTVSSIRATKAGGYFTKDTYYYIPVLPGDVDALSFSMTSNTHGTDTGTTGFDDWKAERVAGSALTFTRGTGLKFDALDQGSKWSWYFDIRDAASLERFRALVAAGTFPAAGVAKFTSDIDLSGVTIAAAAGTFKGTLDGQGHSITNWTSNGVSLLNVVGDGTAKSEVKGITLATSCDFTATIQGKTFGFIAKTIAKTSEMADCHNLANVELAYSEASSTESNFGALAGSCTGTAADCSNEGDIVFTVSSATSTSHWGGVIGTLGAYGNISSLSNSGNITLNASGEVSLARTEVGGIAGYAGGAYSYTALSNSGAITNGIPSENNTLYLGGLFGRLGAVILSSAENTGSVSNTAVVANLWMGGIIGCQQGSTLNASAARAILNTAEVSNSGSSTEQYLGGIIGHNNSAVASVTGAVNEGDVISTGNATNIRIAGICGSVHQNTSFANNVNSGKVEVGSITVAKNLYIAGIVGFNQATITLTARNTNNGPLAIRTTSCANAHVGGIVGSTTTATLTDQLNENRGTIITNGTITTAYMSGIIGYTGHKVNISSCTNNADITLGGSIGTVNLGAGALGHRKDNADEITISDNVNRGAITNTGANGLRVGGIIGYINKTGATISGNKNYGAITNKKACTATSWVGGIMGVGYFTTMEKNINYAEGKISATELSSAALYYGGILGQHQNASSLTSCKNYASVELAPTASFSGQLFLGGITGLDNNATSSYSACENHGDLSISGTSSNTGYNYVSGITTSTEVNLNFTNCINRGNLYVDCSLKWRLGGIAAYVASGTFSGNTVKCNISMNSQSTGDHNIGGMVGYSNRSPYVNCSYEGTIDASGGCNTANKGFSGGLLGSSNGSVKIQGCKVKAVMVKGTNSVTGAFVGGQFNNDNLTYTFEASGASNCKVLSGTTVGGVAVTDGSDDALLVGKRSDKNRTVVQTAIDFE